MIHGRETPATRRRKQNNRRLRILLAALGVVALVVAGYGVYVWRNTCGAGVWRQDAECVGTTDGAYVFDPSLQRVEDLIKQENDKVDGQFAVTVAVLLPMTAGNGQSDLLSTQQIKSHLEGAYLAQRAADENQLLAPKIRLVLANEGSVEQAWQPVTDKLAELVGDSAHPLVAVTGVGVSVRQTAKAAKALAQHQIPLVGSVLSADGLNRAGNGPGVDGPILGFSRVMSSNRDEVSALGRYLGPNQPAAMVVSDGNPDDLYAKTLEQDFETVPETKAAWERSGSLVAPYDAEPGSSGVANEFRGIASRLCDQNAASLVLYAGRAVLLPDLVKRLGDQGCGEKQITVVTGSDATMIQDMSETRTADHVSLIYAGVENPAALADQRNPDRALFQQFADDFLGQRFDQKDLDTGWAIMGNDALAAVVAAIQKATGQQRTPPTPVDVRTALESMNDKFTPVHGASGTFWFDKQTGDRIGRPPSVLELQPHATAPTVVQP